MTRGRRWTAQKTVFKSYRHHIIVNDVELVSPTNFFSFWCFKSFLNFPFHATISKSNFVSSSSSFFASPLRCLSLIYAVRPRRSPPLLLAPVFFLSLFFDIERQKMLRDHTTLYSADSFRDTTIWGIYVHREV